MTQHHLTHRMKAHLRDLVAVGAVIASPNDATYLALRRRGLATCEQIGGRKPVRWKPTSRSTAALLSKEQAQHSGRGFRYPPTPMEVRVLREGARASGLAGIDWSLLSDGTRGAIVSAAVRGCVQRELVRLEKAGDHLETRNTAAGDAVMEKAPDTGK